MAADLASLSAQVNQLGQIGEEADAASAPSELMSMVDDLLNHLEAKFSNISNDLITKLDEMTRRLDNLEATIQAGHSVAESNHED